MPEVFFVQPNYEIDAFHCPICGTYAHQYWSIVRDENARLIPQLKIAHCTHCMEVDGAEGVDTFSIWYKEKLIQPDVTTVPPPNPDLNTDIVDIYNEARSIVNKSPKGAAALLRLCVEKLCDQLDVNGRDLHERIGNLVKNGLPVKIQQALDSVRVIGNNMVHGGQIVLEDDLKTAAVLFDLVNFIADEMITREREIQQIYDSLPQTSLDAITKRDQPKP